ncbi:MAG: hypothetical protein LBG59_02290 [Candidatus Peribacteria bacterium]|jgi:hypothetical protein|nr:hypothetical protein [Candidatus Peribacteria bacterium]
MVSIPQGEFNNDPLLILEAYKNRLKNFFKQQNIKLLNLVEGINALQQQRVSEEYYRAYAQLLLANYGIPARIFPTLNQQEREGYGMSKEICAFIAQYGECEKDVTRFMKHTLGEYDEHFKPQNKYDKAYNLFKTISVDEKSTTFAKQQIEKSLSRMQKEYEKEDNTAVKQQIEKDIIKLKEELTTLSP